MTIVELGGGGGGVSLIIILWYLCFGNWKKVSI